MIKHPEQRVGMLVDVSNMYHSAKNLYNKKTNFQEILVRGIAGRKLIRATAYAIRTENKEEAPFIEAPTGASLPAGQAGKRDLGRAKQTETLYFKNYPYF